MKLRAEVLAIHGGRDEVVVDFNGFDAAEPHAPVAGNTVKSFEQMPQAERRASASAARRFDTVVPDVDSSEHDFAVAMIDKAADFFLDVLGGPAAQAGPDAGDDAKGTLEDAAVLHFDIGALPAIETADARRQMGKTHAVEQIGQLSLVGDNLDDIGKATDRLGVPSGVTAHDDRARVGVVSG